MYLYGLHRGWGKNWRKNWKSKEICIHCNFITKFKVNVDQLHGFYFNHSFSLVCKDLEEGNDVKKAGYILEYLPAYSVLVASGLKLYQTPVNSPVLLMYKNISNRLRYFRAIFLFLSNFIFFDFSTSEKVIFYTKLLSWIHQKSSWIRICIEKNNWFYESGSAKMNATFTPLDDGTPPTHPRSVPEELWQLGIDLESPLIIQPALGHPLQALVQRSLLLPVHIQAF